MKLTLLGIILSLFVLQLQADEKTHTYTNGETITLWANKVGPYRNPQETYEYYSLPFCRPNEIIDRSEGLGEALSGYELIKSNFKILFKTDLNDEVICEVKEGLTQAQVDSFREAVKNQYWFEFFLDELPIWGLVGEDDSIWTHKQFVIKTNQNRIIEVTLHQSKAFKLKTGAPLSWTYSVKWENTDADFEERFDRYLDDKFFEHQIHWFSIFNSFMMVIFLVGLVSIILMRTLRKDISRFAKDLDDLEGVEAEMAEESGWKQVHGDVFRTPPHLTLFSALLGTGTQLLVLVLIVILLAISFYHNHPFYRRGTIVTAFIVMYSLTSFVAGYVSGSHYQSHSGKNWKKCMIYTAVIFPGFVFTLAFLLNFVAVGYGSLAHIPLSTMFIMLLLWVFVAFPITFAGTIVGRNLGGKPDFPCRVNPMPKTIPAKRPYQVMGARGSWWCTSIRFHFH